MIYNRVALIGLGLIASSMAHAMRRDGLAGEITGTARSAETREIARELGFCDHILETAAETVKDADLIVLAPATADLMAKATRGSATSKALGKQTYYAQIDMAQGEAYDFASGVMSAGAVSPDGQEGIAAFVEKRRADFPPRV